MPDTWYLDRYGGIAVGQLMVMLEFSFRLDAGTKLAEFATEQEWTVTAPRESRSPGAVAAVGSTETQFGKQRALSGGL